jgi:formate dehydrogenase subunit delta
MTYEKLIRMANQIAGIFATQPNEDQCAAVATHINDFWEPRMRAQLLAHIADGGADLHPAVIGAAGLIRRPAPV